MGQYEFPVPEWAEVSPEGEPQIPRPIDPKRGDGPLMDQYAATRRLDTRARSEAACCNFLVFSGTRSYEQLPPSRRVNRLSSSNMFS